MADPALPRRPEGWPTIIPRLFAGDVDELVGFIKQVFGASGDLRQGGPAELRLGDSLIMVSDGGGVRHARSSFLYVYVESVEEAYGLAVNAGARVIEEPRATPYGDLRATVEDRWGNVWQIASRISSPT
jgi:uncharacterized glyoxalase superfamily protein PhnB